MLTLVLARQVWTATTGWLRPLGILTVAALLLPTASENHTWGFQSQFHFSLLFLFLAAPLFDSNRPVSARAAALAAVLIGVVSFSTSVIYTAAVTAGLAAKWLTQSMQRRSFKRDTFSALAVIVLASAVVTWLVHFVPVPGHPPMTMPWQPHYWQYLPSLVMWGVGIKARAPDIVRALALIVCLTPAVLLVALRRTKLSPEEYWYLTLLAALMGGLAVVAAGRAGMGVGSANAGRYSELAMPIFPLAFVLWARVLSLAAHPWLERAAAAAAALVVTVVLVQTVRADFSVYRAMKEERCKALACIEDLLDQGDAAPMVACPGVYPVPVNDRLERAKSLGISFTQKRQAHACVSLTH
jgi:hypothetical protein